MTDKSPLYNVIIDASGISLAKLEPGGPGYRKASKGAILRQRDALERYRGLKAAGKSFHGVYSFYFLDTAKTFAMLRLAALQHEIQDNLDRVQTYDGSAKSSSREVKNPLHKAGVAKTKGG